MIVISVIIRSTRQGRFSEKPAQWIFQHFKKRSGVEARLLDLRDFPMPFFDQPVPLPSPIVRLTSMKSSNAGPPTSPHLMGLCSSLRNITTGQQPC